MCALTYYIQLTVVRFNHLQMPLEVMQPFTFIPGTPLFSQDMLGYRCLYAATLAAWPAFSGGKLATWIKWLFILQGVLFLAPTFIVPAIPLPTNEAGTGFGNQVGVYVNLLWSAYFAVTPSLAVVLFRALGRNLPHAP